MGMTKTEARVRAWAATAENRELADRLFPVPADPLSVELPAAPWFKLSMYAPVYRWTAHEWLAAVHWRWGAWASLEGPTGDPRPIAKVAYFITGLARDVVTGGAVAVAEPQAFGAPTRPAVTEVDPDDIAELAANHEFGSPSERKLLSVDLKASDAAIVAAFEAWLKRQRPLADRREALTEADMRTFADSRAIPFLDLQLFQLATGRRIPVVEVAAALFPAGPGEQTVNSPTKKLERATRRDAERLLSTRCLNRLTAQFAPPP